MGFLQHCEAGNLRLDEAGAGVRAREGVHVRRRRQVHRYPPPREGRDVVVGPERLLHAARRLVEVVRVIYIYICI